MDRQAAAAYFRRYHRWENQQERETGIFSTRKNIFASFLKHYTRGIN